MATKTLTTLLLVATLAVGNAASAVESKIIAIDGTVTYARTVHPHPHAATVGQPVGPGYKIMTRPGSRAAIAFMESADTPLKKADLMLLGADTTVEIVAQSGDDVPPIEVRVLSGSYRAQVRNGSKLAHFTIRAGDRVVELERADVSGTDAPDTDNAKLMCRDGKSVIRAGKRRVKVAKGMYRAIDRGKILGARKMTSDQWNEGVAARAVTGVDVTMPEPPERAALAKPNKDGNFELVLTPDGVLPKEAVMPTTQGQLENAAAEGSPDKEVEYVRMMTTKGEIVLELDRTNAPISTKNFLQYVDDGFYDGTIFHRVMSNFMIQGGGFEAGMSKKQTRPGIKNEWQNGLTNDRGTIAMARLGGQADSGTSQFFINVVDNAGLDRPRDGSAYAVFGRVVAGMDVVDAIRNVSTTTVGGYANVPSEDVVILSVERSTREEALE